MILEIRRKDVKTLVAQGRAQLVDGLPAPEYRKEHLPFAVGLPLETITAAGTKPLRKDQAVIVYSADCQCDRSARAAWRLESMGFQSLPVRCGKSGLARIRMGDQRPGSEEDPDSPGVAERCFHLLDS